MSGPATAAAGDEADAGLAALGWAPGLTCPGCTAAVAVSSLPGFWQEKATAASASNKTASLARDIDPWRREPLIGLRCTPTASTQVSLPAARPVRGGGVSPAHAFVP